MASKTMVDEQHRKTDAPAHSNMESDPEVDLLQALLARRQRYAPVWDGYGRQFERAASPTSNVAYACCESNAGGSLRRHHPLFPSRPYVNEPAGTTSTRSQQIARILADSLQQQELPNSPAPRSFANPTKTGGDAFPVLVDTANRGISDLSSRRETFQVQEASADSDFPLPMKLYAVLSTPKFEHIISWQPHGRAFKIQDLDLFCAQVLPIFMNGSSSRHFHGFVSLLNLWGFRQFTNVGPDISAFFHPVFLRGHPSLLQTMGLLTEDNRVPLHDPSSEPNLYALPSLSKEKKPSDEQQVNLSTLPPELLRPVVESLLPAVQGLRERNPARLIEEQQQQQQQQTAPTYSRASLFPTNAPASPPRSANLSSMQALGAMESLLAAKQVRDASQLNFERSNNSNHMLRLALQQHSAAAPAATTPMPCATVATATISGPRTVGTLLQQPAVAPAATIPMPAATVTTTAKSKPHKGKETGGGKKTQEASSRLASSLGTGHSGFQIHDDGERQQVRSSQKRCQTEPRDCENERQGIALHEPRNLCHLCRFFGQ